MFTWNEIPVVDELSQKEASDTSKFSSRLEEFGEDIIQLKKELRSIRECMSDLVGNMKRGQKLMMKEFKRMIEQIKPIEATPSSHDAPSSNIPVDNEHGPAVHTYLGKDLRVEDGAYKDEDDKADSFEDCKADSRKEFDLEKGFGENSFEDGKADFGEDFDLGNKFGEDSFEDGKSDFVGDFDLVKKEHDSPIKVGVQEKVKNEADNIEYRRLTRLISLNSHLQKKGQNSKTTSRFKIQQ